MLCGFAFGSRRHDHRDDEDDADERPEGGRVPAELSQLRKEREQVREGPLESIEREEKNDIDQNQQRAPILLPDDLFSDPINGFGAFLEKGFGCVKIEWHTGV